jgi:parallel beta-helix repeat protein
MKRKTLLAWTLLLLAVASPKLPAQNTVFTYQGRLNEGTNPASGTYDLRFAIYDAQSNGNPAGTAITNFGVVATNGFFLAQLDFGAGVFNGSPRWLEVGVRTNGAGGFMTLTPRQAITSVPYAITAANVASSGLSGTYGSPLVFNNPANQFVGSFAGNGVTLSNLNASQLNVGVVPLARLATNAAGAHKILYATSATTAKWEDAPEPVINIRAYGAVGDGVTLDRAAIQAAALAIPPQGGTLLIPRGTYLLDRTTLPEPNSGKFAIWVKSNTVIQAESGAVLKMASSVTAQTDLIVVSDGTHYGGANNVQIRGLTIDGNTRGRRVGIDGGEGIHFLGGSNQVVSGCHIFDAPEDGIDFGQPVGQVLVENTRIENCWGAGIHSLGRGGTRISNCYFRSNGWLRLPQWGYVGAALDNSFAEGNAEVTGTVFEDNAVNVYVQSGLISLQNCELRQMSDNRTNVLVQQYGQLVMNGCFCYSPGVNGVGVLIEQDDSRARITGNEFFFQGVKIQGGTSDAVISGNSFYGGGLRAIQVLNGKQVLIAANSFLATHSGVRLESASNVRVIGNAFSDIETSGIYVGGGTNNFLSGNDFQAGSPAQLLLSGQRNHSFNNRISGDLVIQHQFNVLQGNRVGGKIHFNGAAAINTELAGNHAADVLYTSSSSPQQTWGINYGVLATNSAITQLRLNGARVLAGAGAPEGAIAAPTGSLYLRTDGGAGSSLYIKESGTGNTGWVAK